jgi:hypothetical protein
LAAARHDDADLAGLAGFRMVYRGTKWFLEKQS